MHTNRTRAGIVLLVGLSLVLCHAVRGDYVELRDGSVIEGTVLKTKDGYWVKTKDGESKQLSAAQVKSTGKGSKPGTVKATPAAKGKPAAGAVSSSGKTARITDYATAERRAHMVEAPMAAVAIWQEFIDSEPPADELAKAEAELAKWKKMADDGSEKIKGKWVGGAERKAIIEKSKALYNEATSLMKGNQTLQAVEKLKESVAVYPNSFNANFEIAYLMMIQYKAKDAEKYLLAAQRLRPNTPEVMANLALIEIDRRQHVKGIEMLHKAAQQGDKKAIVENLICAIVTAPRAASKNKKVMEATAAARLLASKYGVPEQSNQFVIVGLTKDGDKPGEKGMPDHDDGMPGIAGNGSGSIIDKSGLILTNKHVVEQGKTFLVAIDGKKQRSAEVVVMDDEQDLALIRIKLEPGEVLPVVPLSPTDVPPDGAACTVMGFPLMTTLGERIKVTRGIVTSTTTQFKNGPDVIVDAKINPGNSGGPILDKYGYMMAVASAKTYASTTEDAYGLGISVGQVRKFLAKNKVELAKAVAPTKVLDTEEIAATVKPAAVCILVIR